MIFGIPSYRRPQCKTIDTLKNLGFLDTEIVVALQDESDVSEYKAVHPNTKYIYRKTDCAAGNRNTLLSALPRPLILLDDDISSFSVKVPNRNFKAIQDGFALKSLLYHIIQIAQINNCALIGCAPTSNDIIAKRRAEYSFDCLLQGTFLIVLKKINFNEKWKMVEDYELCLRLIRKNGSNNGGMHERYENNELPLWISRLDAIFPEFQMNKSKTGGYVKF